jgi:hypothetical protein
MGKVWIRDTNDKLKEFAKTTKTGDFEVIPSNNKFILREIKIDKK